MTPVAVGCILDTRGNGSRAKRLLKRPDLRAKFGRGTGCLSLRAVERLRYDWTLWGRANQQLSLEQDWSYWYIRAGRGWGKTATAAQAVIKAKQMGCRKIALIGRTAFDLNATMIPAILEHSPPWDRPVWQKAQRRLLWKNGCIATAYSADKPDLLRGPQHDFAWLDEAATFRYLEAVISNLEFGLRLKSGPCRIVVTSTPKRSCIWLRELAKAPSTLLTEGSTYDNLANLHARVRSRLLKYRGTTLEAQEIFGRDVDNVDGALWQQEILDKHRILDPVKWKIENPRYLKIVAGVDPTSSDRPTVDEVGIVIAALTRSGQTVFLDDFSGKMSPEKWAKTLVRACLKYRVNEISCETNNFAALIELTIRNAFKDNPQANCPRIVPLLSTEDKATRAEPVSALYDIGMVRHLGHLVELELQQISWIPGLTSKSPGRIDALVFAVNALNPNNDSGSGGLRSVNTRSIVPNSDAWKPGMSRNPNR